MKERRFVIDLARCTGCQACSIACKDRAGLPDELDWLHVKGHEGGEYPAPSLYYRVTHCFHCDQPACAAVCPTEAIGQTADGWIAIDAPLCIACEACAEACPFSAIVMEPEGVASKCDGCADQVSRGWDPACVRACLIRALAFGPASETSLRNRAQDYTFDDHGISPSVLYLRR